MAMMPRRLVLAVVVIALTLAGLLYLRDPAWLLTTTSGMRGWETDETGIRLRWTGGHASFFVPADSHWVELPVRTTFDRADDRAITVSVSIDDRLVDRVVLTDSTWHRILIGLPPRGTRRVRRIDVRTDRTREDNRGAALGEVSLR
jgi:hypothetical protein